VEGGDADLSDRVWFDGDDSPVEHNTDDENEDDLFVPLREPRRRPVQSSIHKTRHHTNDGLAGCKSSSNREEADTVVPSPRDDIHDATLDCITVEGPKGVDDGRDSIRPLHREGEVKIDLALDERDDDEGDSAYEESEGDVSFTSDRARRTGQEDTLYLSNAEDQLHSATLHLQSL
jgi:hypothetical protein